MAWTILPVNWSGKRIVGSDVATTIAEILTSVDKVYYTCTGSHVTWTGGIPSQPAYSDIQGKRVAAVLDHWISQAQTALNASATADLWTMGKFIAHTETIFTVANILSHIGYGSGWTAAPTRITHADTKAALKQLQEFLEATYVVYVGMGEKQFVHKSGSDLVSLDNAYSFMSVSVPVAGKGTIPEQIGDGLCINATDFYQYEIQKLYMRYDFSAIGYDNIEDCTDRPIKMWRSWIFGDTPNSNYADYDFLLYIQSDWYTNMADPVAMWAAVGNLEFAKTIIVADEDHDIYTLSKADLENTGDWRMHLFPEDETQMFSTCEDDEDYTYYDATVKLRCFYRNHLP